MKITIKYELDPKYDTTRPCWASTHRPDGTLLIRCGASYAEARERLINDLRLLENIPPAPAPEDVEL